MCGTKAGLGQWVGEISPERLYASRSKFVHRNSWGRQQITNQHCTSFFSKSAKAMPYISAQYRTNSPSNKIKSCVAQVPIIDTNGRKIDLAPWPKEINEKGIVRFVENGRAEADVMKRTTCKPNVLILAIGYTKTFSFLDAPYPRPQDANIRSVWGENDDNIVFMGFVRPSFGK